MTATNSDVYYDPYDPAIYTDPYPVFNRIREEAPLYYNSAYDFYAVSRYRDIEAAYRDKETYISSHGDVLEMIKADVELPRGSLIFEDPPIHTAHRGLMSRVFTPKRCWLSSRRCGTTAPLPSTPLSGPAASTSLPTWPPRCR